MAKAEAPAHPPYRNLVTEALRELPARHTHSKHAIQNTIGERGKGRHLQVLAGWSRSRLDAP